MKNLFVLFIASFLSLGYAHADGFAPLKIKCVPAAVDPIEFIGAQGGASLEGTVTIDTSVPTDSTSLPAVKADVDVALTETPNDSDPTGIVFKDHILMTGYYASNTDQNKIILNYHKEETDGTIERSIDLSFDLRLTGEEPSEFQYSIAPFYGKCTVQKNP